MWDLAISRAIYSPEWRTCVGFSSHACPQSTFSHILQKCSKLGILKTIIEYTLFIF